MANRLINSHNPYLRQHAENPVDWYPWGEEAFAKARAEDKPIFLSIGYSTCHWCHVMARESFENTAVAAYLNEHFVNIKVDREEHPDVDHLYMVFVQATTGSGGWPLNVFLTPELKPFFGGTYFPPEEMEGRIAFPLLIGQITNAWKKQRDRINESVEEVIGAIEEMSTLTKSDAPSDSWKPIWGSCLKDLGGAYDPDYGGFGGAPLFPRPVVYDFLHAYHYLEKSQQSLEMSSHSLRKMAEGGIHDQLGGGFHRYSVDPYWIVPHFEKMLYDQAQLATSFLEIYQLTGEEFFAKTARDTLDYVLRDLRDENGGFCAAEDADSPVSHRSTETHEGLFYIWAEAEIDAVLGGESRLFKERYDIRPNGNAPAQGDPSGEFRDTNILYVARDLDGISERFGLSKEKIVQRLEHHKKVLFDVRLTRPRPHRDNKIIAAWNGLMISALARGGFILNEPKYTEAALQAAQFIKENLYDAESGTLGRHYCKGNPQINGYSSDYASMIEANIALYEATFDVSHLLWAEQLADHLKKYFWDEESFGFYDAQPDPHVLLRFKTVQGSAEPAPNSQLAGSLIKLAELLGRKDFRETAGQTFEAYHDRLKQSSTLMPKMLKARITFEQPAQHIVIVKGEDDASLQELLGELRWHYLPLANIVLITDENRDFWSERMPWTADMKAINGKTAAYVCQDFACQAPVSSAADLCAILDEE